MRLSKQKQKLTQKRLKELVHYDPLTGVFSRLVATSRSVKVGDIIGNDSGGGYLQTRIAGHNYYLHRLAFLYMTGAFPSEQVDHKNHDQSDNRWLNLRAATQTENQRNRSANVNNTSGHTGVSWCRRDKPWKAQICVNGKRKHIGLFRKKSDAIEAREQANLKYNFHPNHGKSTPI